LVSQTAPPPVPKMKRSTKICFWKYRFSVRVLFRQILNQVVQSHFFTSLWNGRHNATNDFLSSSSFRQVCVCFFFFSASYPSMNCCSRAGMQIGVWNCHTIRGIRKPDIFTSIVHVFCYRFFQCSVKENSLKLPSTGFKMRTFNLFIERTFNIFASSRVRKPTGKKSTGCCWRELAFIIFLRLAFAVALFSDYHLIFFFQRKSHVLSIYSVLLRSFVVAKRCLVIEFLERSIFSTARGDCNFWSRLIHFFIKR
jgi:hypothetical protein